MGILKKKIILWSSVGVSMILVMLIWFMSLATYHFSITESKKQVQELKEHIQEKLEDIKFPETSDLNLEATPVAPKEPKLKLPLEE